MLYTLFAALCILFIAVVLFYKFNHKRKFFARRLLTPSEQKMYSRLKQAFPEHDVLCQVAFSALITNQHYKIRSQFNRKVTDFVLINQHCDVVAIIELDDPTHLDKVEEDKFRDQMLQEAGYAIFRYTEIPSISRLRRSISI